jgi:hypothetical protein
MQLDHIVVSPEVECAAQICDVAKEHLPEVTLSSVLYTNWTLVVCILARFFESFQDAKLLKGRQERLVVGQLLLLPVKNFTT